MGEEQGGSYFTAKVNEAIDEILSGKELPSFNTVEELFADLKTPHVPPKEFQGE